MAEAVELFKAKATEHARFEAAEKEAKKEANAAERRAEMQRLADGFESAVGSIVAAAGCRVGRLRLPIVRELERGLGGAEPDRERAAAQLVADDSARDPECRVAARERP